MPVQTVTDSNSNNLYCHVYNRGTTGNIIFFDDEDHKVFLDFLREYLSAPENSESTKKTFNIRGRAFRGTPHQPKNYYGKVELIAYSASPDHFHLLLNLKHKDSLQGFIRSLCTRYSMYFNKKHHRVGSLFHGPYKSILIKDESSVLQLTRFLHTHGASTYPEYIGTRVTSWVKPQAILSYFDTVKDTLASGPINYKYFVEEYKPSQKELELLSKLTFENASRNFESKGATKNETAQKIKTYSRIPEYVILNTVFFFLLTMGVCNILAPPAAQYNLFTFPVTKNFIAKIASPLTRISPSVINSHVLGAKTKSISATKDIKIKKYISINIDNGQQNIGVYKKPGIDAEQIGLAKNGEIFEEISTDGSWCQIKLTNGSTGFVLSKYVK
jgi:putative transposase